ncbi:50S ribosomal protein L22 [Planctomycetota bacterium]|nr:50S ribosomal protein L22 [Planctomycetota bacterium]
MAYINVHRGARISSSKARLVTDMIRGKSVDEALAMLVTSKKRAAVFVKSALNAAIANADQAEANVRNLRVTDARVDEGPVMKRFQPKDRGRAHPIMKRTSHITVAVDEA